MLKRWVVQSGRPSEFDGEIDCEKASKHTDNNHTSPVNPPTCDTLLDTPIRGLHFPLLLSPRRAMRSHGSSSNNGTFVKRNKYRYWKNYRVNAWDAEDLGVPGNEAHE